MNRHPSQMDRQSKPTYRLADPDFYRGFLRRIVMVEHHAYGFILRNRIATFCSLGEFGPDLRRFIAGLKINPRSQEVYPRVNVEFRYATNMRKPHRGTKSNVHRSQKCTEQTHRHKRQHQPEPVQTKNIPPGKSIAVDIDFPPGENPMSPRDSHRNQPKKKSHRESSTRDTEPMEEPFDFGPRRHDPEIPGFVIQRG